jgi:hypothetical protein
MTHSEAIAEISKRGWAEVTPIVWLRKCELILEERPLTGLKITILGSGETWEAAFADADKRAEGVTV